MASLRLQSSSACVALSFYNEVATSNHMKYCELPSCAKVWGGDVTLRRVVNLLRLLALQLWWEKH